MISEDIHRSKRGGRHHLGPSLPVVRAAREQNSLGGSLLRARIGWCLLFLVFPAFVVFEHRLCVSMSTFSFSRGRIRSLGVRGLGLVLVLWMGLFVGAAAAQSESEPAAVVGMTNTLKFTPDTVRVDVGETVRWENTSIVVHTVTADPEEATLDESVRLPEGASPFDSGNMDPEATFEHTFEVPGTYRYFCIPHEATKMFGTVIVKPADE